MLIIWALSEAIKLCSNMHYLILGADDSYRIIKIIEYVGDKVKEVKLLKDGFIKVNKKELDELKNLE